MSHTNTQSNPKPTDTHILPSRARVWAQLIECPELPLHHLIPTQQQHQQHQGVAPCVGYRGRPTPLYLAPPSSSSSSSSSNAGPGPIPTRALSEPFPLLEIDFAGVVGEEAEAPSTQHVNGPLHVGAPVSVAVKAPGTVHGVLMWWELTVRGLIELKFGSCAV